MMPQIKRWLASPKFPDDETKTLRAELLNAALINILTLVPVLLVGNALGGRTPLPVFAADVLGFLLCLVLRAWMHRGRVHLASIGLIATGLVLITTSVASLGTVRAPATAMYMLVIITGGLLFELRGLVITSALCSLLVVGLIGAGNAGLLPRPDYTVTITQWVAYTAIFTWTGSLVYSVLQAMRQTLTRADRVFAERRRAEQEVRESEELFSKIFQTSPVGINIFRFSDDRSFIVNDAFLEIMGYTREEVVGHTTAELHLFVGKSVHKTWMKTLREGGEVRNQDVRIRHKSGEIRHVLVSLYAIEMNDAHMVLVMMTNITEWVRSEEALRESEALLRTIAENYPDSYLSIVEKDLTIGFMSGQEFKKQNLNPDQYLGMTLEQVFGDQAPVVREHYVNTFAGKEQSFELFINDLHQLYRTVPLYAHDGSVPRILSVVENITERKRTQNELAASEAKYRAFFENSMEAILLTSPDGDIRAANPTACQMFGRTEKEITQAGRAGLVDASDPRLPSLLAERAKSGKARGELTMLRGDGTPFPVEVSSALFQDINGETRTSMIIRDITARLRAEHALRESEAYLRRAEEIAHVGYWSRNVASREISWSDETCRIFGLEPPAKKLDLTTLLEYIHPEDRQMVSQAIQDAVAGVRPYDLRYRALRPDGTVRWVHSKGELVYDGNGQPERMFGVALDITDRVQAEEALSQRAEQLAALHAVLLEISGRHDLPTLLQSIVERAVALLGADGGGLYLCDPEKSQCLCAVSFKTPQDYTGTVLAYGEGAAGTVAQTGQALIIDDYRSWARRAAAFEVEQPFRALIAMPITWQGQVVGVLHALRQEPESFKQADQELLGMFAGHAAIAIENARLLQQMQVELTERKNAEAALRESMVIFRNLFDNTEVGMFRTRSDGSEILNANEKFLEIFGRTREEVIGKPSVIHWADPLQREEMVRRLKANGRVVDFECKMLNKNGDVRDCLTSLNLYPEEGILDGSIMDITERVQAEQERVRLLEQVRLGRKRLQVLSKQLLSVQEAERRAIALELHDRIGQDLTALKIDLQSAKRDREMPALKQRLGQTIDSLGQVLQRIRELSLELRPSILDDLGLAAALRWYIDQQTRAVDMRIEYHLEALEPRPEAEIEIACFRVAQEALTNILRHSQASVVRVTLEAGENLLRLTIQDDGIGFEPADAYERALQGESLGVLGMRERVELTGGELKIDSTPGRGTTLQACFSLDTSRSPEHRQKERHSP